MRLYENVLILHPELDEEQVDSHIERFTAIVDRLNGQLAKIEKWGKKKLAYPVKKHRYGFYVLLRFHGTPELIGELERNYRLMDTVLRYLTVHLEREPVDTVPLLDDDIPDFEEVVSIDDVEEDEEEEIDLVDEDEGEEEEEARSTEDEEEEEDEETKGQKSVEEAH